MAHSRERTAKDGDQNASFSGAEWKQTHKTLASGTKTTSGKNMPFKGLVSREGIEPSTT
jgi:hypothetical protein